MKSSADADSINQTFIHPSNYTPVSFGKGDDMTVTGISREAMLDLRLVDKVTTRVDHDSLHLVLLMYVAVALTDAVTSLNNSSLSSSSIADYWTPVTIVCIQQSSNSTALEKLIRPIVITFSGL